MTRLLGIASAIGLLLGGCTSFGCSNLFRSEIGRALDSVTLAAETSTDLIRKQGLIEDFLANLNANVINPEIVAGVRIDVQSYTGVHGAQAETTVSTAGQGAQVVPPELQATMIEWLLDPNTPNDLRLKLIDMLGITPTPSE